MKTKVLHLAIAGAIAVTASNANATTLTENFNAPFPAWQSGWFGLNSNAQSIYADPTSRGNNPDGLWLSTTGITSVQPINVVFNSAFAQSLSSFALDVAGFAPTTLTFFAANGTALSATSVTLTQGAFTNPGVYAHYSVTSTSGIGGFMFSGQASGNTSVDNLVAVTADAGAVPEPATWAMMMLGMGAVGFAMRRRSKNVTKTVAYAA